jgi:uncharacterized repeat protein (TIGR03806 family)
VDDGGITAAPDAAPPLAATGLDARVTPQTCLAPERPVLATGVALEEVFPRGTFAQPLAMAMAPGDPSTFYVAERGGRIRKATRGATPTAFLQFPSDTVDARGEGGFLGFAFHPRWASGTREVVVSYTVRGTQTPLRSMIARVRSTDGGATLDATTFETLLTIDQPYTNHNGGGVGFGPDGLLYLGFGDGGAAGDPLNAGQRTDTLLGKMLRIDVDRREGTLPYAIPPTNPFATSTTSRREIYAWGLRNPWRWSFDTKTGDLWAGDVGQDRYEEIDLITRGGNYGWKLREGARCYPGGDDACTRLGLVDPVFSYGRADGVSITGGYVYRGSRIPGLAGTYVFGDFANGSVWALDDDGRTKQKRLLAQLPANNLASFGQDANGEVYALSLGTGAVHMLAPAAPPPPNTFPAKLSATGCVDPRAPKRPAASLIPYEPRSPLWSDGARMGRFIALPDGATVSLDAGGDFVFPNGTVLVKHFDLGAERIETRLYVRHTDGIWSGYSYAWNTAQTDADLLEAGEVRRWGSQEWAYPSRADCNRCHTEAAGFSLGLELTQLEHSHRYDATGRTANQRETLAAIGLFDVSPAPPAKPLADPFGPADLTVRARSYLHANCSGCHRPNGGARGDLDLRFETPLARTGICDTPPTTDTLGLPNARIVAPGIPESSVLLMRMRSLEGTRMPPLASRRVDEGGAALVEAWIRSLRACE